MNDRTKDNPFTLGVGDKAMQEGRGEEIGVFMEMLGHLEAERDEDGRLQDDPFPAIRLIAPRGGGRRSLLSWVAKSAWRKDILVARCSFPKAKDAGGGFYEPLLAAMAAEETGWINKKARGLLRSDFGHADIRLYQAQQRPGQAVHCLMSELPKHERLLLIMEDVERCDSKKLDDFLLAIRETVRANYPLSLVLAGTPLLDACLAKRKVVSIHECDRVYISGLSDDATWRTLCEPSEKTHSWADYDALKALEPHTENYPLFVHLAGSVVWEATAGRKEATAKLVKKCEGDIRKAKEDFFASCKKRLEARGLLPYAQPVMELLEDNGGKASAEELEETVAKAKPRPKGDDKVEEICDGLHEESFVWTVYDEVRPGIPSLFDYIKARKQ